MEKAKGMITFLDNLLGKFRKVFVNILTVIFLMLITFGIFGSIGSLFESDEIIISLKRLVFFAEFIE